MTNADDKEKHNASNRKCDLCMVKELWWKDESSLANFYCLAVQLAWMRFFLSQLSVVLTGLQLVVASLYSGKGESLNISADLLEKIWIDHN
jgi:hypothetical protein